MVTSRKLISYTWRHDGTVTALFRCENDEGDKFDRTEELQAGDFPELELLASFVALRTPNGTVAAKPVDPTVEIQQIFDATQVQEKKA